MPNYQITCETPNAEIRYTIDGSEPNKNSTLYSGVFSSDNIPRAKAWADGYRESVDDVLVMTVGDTITLDGIEILVIYSQDGINIAVDKNHDLSFYVKGSDYVNSSDYDQSPGTFGYEWGGYETATGITATEVGTGLANTNALIGMNLQPNTSGWWIIWDKVKEFRQNHSDNWFVPSKDELNLVYQQKANLSNISTSSSGYPYYWSSSESSSNLAWYQLFDSGRQDYYFKLHHYRRVRLCVRF